MSDDAMGLARSRRLGGVMTDFDGTRLSLARRLRRLPRTLLAAKVSVSAAAITQFEKGLARPTNAAVAELSLVLGVPPEFFQRGRPIDLLVPTAAHFRSLRSTPAISRDQALAFAELAYAAVDLLEQYVDFPDYDLPLHPVDDTLTSDEIGKLALATRKEMGVASGPISHVVRLLESRGVVVLKLPDTIDSRVDAFSTAGSRRGLVLLSESKSDRARSRFDAAHELGHLVMHPDVEPGSRLVENQAHQFASEFLAPQAELLDELPKRIDWAQLHRLKAKWGLSLRALSFREHLHGVWSDTTYRRAMQILAEQGFPEAGALGPAESPSMLGAAVDLLESSGIPFAEIAAAGRAPESILRTVINAGSESRPKLNVVPRP